MPELSVSTYDTAWVAMVPSPHSPKEPCFRECLSWLMENQCPDGSWARPHQHQYLRKDILSSTLACVIALKKWGVGEEQIEKGVRFIQFNFAAASDDHQICPMGFDIIFPEMLECARDLFLNLDLEPTTLNAMIYMRDMELKSYQSRLPEMEAYMAYIAEGMAKFLDWESIMKYQRTNGSLFNSPSATAAAYIGLPNANSLRYLQSAVKKFGNTVPASYPLDIYCRLRAVDNIESLGISHYFWNEIQDVLDETYRSWLQGDEQIFMDASACALAFRLLRMHGYSVTSDQITRVIEDFTSGTFYESRKDMHTALDLYKASQLIINPNELDLEKQKSRLKHLLEQDSEQLSRNIDQEVGYDLQYPFYTVIDRIGKRRNIEHYKLNNTRILKTSYFSANFAHKDFLSLSLEDFNRCQSMHRNELKELERWVIDNGLDVLKFARQKFEYCYFSAAATTFTPELYEARMSWAKNAVLTTVVDDFFDHGGSMEELEELVQLFEAWDNNVNRKYSSQNVQIIYSALRRTICEIGDQGHILQGRDVTNHIREIWLDLLHSMMKEAEWERNNYHPTMDEYMDNAYISMALGPIILPALYLLGPKLSEKMVSHPEYRKLFWLSSTYGRLLNDIRTCEREMKDGKLNAIPLYLMNNDGEMTEESAIEKINSLIESNRKEVLRSVLEGKNSVIPRPCKDLFWHIVTVLNFTYSNKDGFTSEDFNVVKQILHEPIVRNDI